MKQGCVFFVLMALTALSYAQMPYDAAYAESISQSNSIAQIDFSKDSTTWQRPKKATVLAMLLPGAGQLYNKKYLKASVVYAGIGGLIYSYRFNKDSLATYQAILVNKIQSANDTSVVDEFPLLTTAGVTSNRDFYRRNRDFTIIGFVALYALQIIDANVDAHLREFEINKDLSLRISPDLMRTRPGIGTYTGATLTLRLK
ncbi:MAG: DUF5683 domain-containing protein [Bacteroidia bacterium]|jgi:hypothetical protein|nr:DUF5683 domain-containing protein [Bacteroidia bacterium]